MGTHSSGAASGPQSLWGNPGSDLVAGEGYLLLLLPPSQVPSSFPSSLSSSALSTFPLLSPFPSLPLPPSWQVEGWAPYAVGLREIWAL